MLGESIRKAVRITGLGFQCTKPELVGVGMSPGFMNEVNNLSVCIGDHDEARMVFRNYKG